MYSLRSSLSPEEFLSLNMLPVVRNAKLHQEIDESVVVVLSAAFRPLSAVVADENSFQ